MIIKLGKDYAGYKDYKGLQGVKNRQGLNLFINKIKHRDSNIETYSESNNRVGSMAQVDH